MRSILAGLCLLLFAACVPTGQVTVAPSPTATVTGSVTIETPHEGTVIYSEVIYISGTAANVSDNQFDLVLIGPDEAVIASSTVQVSDGGTWEIELPHTYNDTPAEVIMTARARVAGINGDYDAVTIGLAGLDYRPEDTFASVTFPPEGSTAGGEQFPVSGMVSGLTDQQLTVSLLAADGTALDSQTITIDHPYPLDDVPWTGELATAGYTGDATLQISTSDQQTLDSINIRIETTAG